jgi:uncharacterized damage-inducible protein DinB
MMAMLTPAKAQRALTQNIRLLRGILEAVSGKEARQLRDEGENGWNTVEVLCHMADFEDIFIDRMRSMVNEEMPTFPSYNPDERVISQQYKARRFDEALVWFVDKRHEHLEYLKTLTGEQWQRRGIHTEFGETTVLEHAYNIVGHDINHMDQILKILGEA